MKIKKLYWDCSCVADLFGNDSQLTIAKPWWKEIESKEIEMVDGLPNPLISVAEKPAETSFFSAAVDGYCPVDCQTQFYSLLGFMFIAGMTFTLYLTNHRLPRYFKHFASIHHPMSKGSE